MVSVKKEGVLLSKTALGFENEGVLNPAVIKDDEFIHLFYRAVSKGNYSSIGYCRLKGPLTIEERKITPVITPSEEYETQGVEDPRIVKIDDLFYLTYTAYDGVNAMGALATSKDLVSFEKMGVIVPQVTFEQFKHLAECKSEVNEKYIRYNQPWGTDDKDGKKLFIWDKNVIFFPRRINNRLHFIHRIRPDIQIADVQQLDELTEDFWRQYIMNLENNIMLAPMYEHEVSYIGGGCPPIETEDGWLMIYHGVHDSLTGYVYNACAALFEIDNPRKEIARLPYPLFSPDESWEKIGYVNNVCFPTGAILNDDRLYIYYGAADENIACASVSLNELLAELKVNARYI